jgi:hypothetical protein
MTFYVKFRTVGYCILQQARPFNTLTHLYVQTGCSIHSAFYQKCAGNSPSHAKRPGYELEQSHQTCALVNLLNC